MKLKLPVTTIHSVVHCTLKQGAVKRVLDVSKSGTNPSEWSTRISSSSSWRGAESQVTQHP